MKESTLVSLVVVGTLAYGGVGVWTDLSERSRQEAQAAQQQASVAPRCEVLGREELVPGAGALFGVNLDWVDKPLADYALRLGHKPAVSVSFTGFPYDERGHRYLRMAADQIRADGQMMLLTLEPEGGLQTVTEETAQELAADLAEINDSGVPVIVRFAHEMNGSWYAWGQQPVAYVETYRRVAEAVHERVPGSAMLRSTLLTARERRGWGSVATCGTTRRCPTLLGRGAVVFETKLRDIPAAGGSAPIGGQPSAGNRQSGGGAWPAVSERRSRRP